MAPDDATLVAIAAVVRRALAARTPDPHVAEDLTQETLVKIAAAADRLDGDALQAYALVTARHLLADHGRRSDVQRRHQHRLVEFRSLTGPEEATLQAEETDALAVALDRLGPDDRHLLLAHEVEGRDLEALADRHETSKGAVAVRLARIRATVRVDFLLAFRRTTLPTNHCRPVLLALSAGDTRRQHALGAADHLLACPTCASLSRPLLERRRAIASIGWIAAGGALARRVADKARAHPVAAATGVTGTLAVAGVLTFAAWPSSPTPTAQPVPATATTTASAVTTVVTAATTTTPATTPSPPGSLSVDGTTLPLHPDLRAYVDHAISGTDLVVVSVPAPLGFWVAADGGTPIWVQLDNADGHPAGTFVTGQHLDLAGTVQALTEPPSQFDLEGDDAARLEAEGYYLAVDHDDVTIRP